MWRVHCVSEPSLIYKVCVIGSGGVGKSSAVKRYSEGIFSEDYQVTVGVNHSTQTVSIDGQDGPTDVKMIVWDLGGQDKFKFVRPMFYRAARGIVLMFDITNRASFEVLPKWIREAEDNVGTKVPFVVAANKTDLPNYAVSFEEIQVFADSIGANVIFTSVKTDTNVSNMFKQLGTAVYESKMCEHTTSNIQNSIRSISI